MATKYVTKNAPNNFLRIPAKNEVQPENIALPEKQNHSHKTMSNASIPVQLWNNKLATSRNQQGRYQNKETPDHTQNVPTKINASQECT